MYAALRKCDSDLRTGNYTQEELYNIARCVYSQPTEGEDPNVVLWVKDLEDRLTKLGWSWSKFCEERRKRLSEKE